MNFQIKKIILFLIIVIVGCTKSNDGTVEIIPLPPKELKVALISKEQVDLTWLDKSTNETGYKIERRTDSGNFSEIGMTSQDVTIFSDKTVNLNTNYTYRVYSFNQMGKSISYSNEVTIKTLGIPTLITYAVSQISSSGAISGGTVSSDGGSPITSLGIVWDTNTNPTISLSTKSSSTTNPGLGTFKSVLTGLKASSKYYVRAYATNSAGTSYGNELSFNTDIFTFNTVVGANGRIWMDRNLGATRVATSSTDEAAFGDLYQWGRGSDGHQIRNSGITTIRSGTNNPTHGNFITYSTNESDWRAPQNANLWQGVNGINNPCPNGYRLPTEAEWNAERLSWTSNNAAGAMASSLKLPMAGMRFSSNGLVSALGSVGDYWTSTTSGNFSRYLGFANSYANINVDGRAYGFCVRCIKD
jgi:uncharacterized protein (TIGR02145 family)